MASARGGLPDRFGRRRALALVLATAVLFLVPALPGSLGAPIPAHSGAPASGTLSAAPAGSWLRLGLATNATPVAGQALAYDAADSELVQFGGTTSVSVSGKNAPTSETWVLHGRGPWVQLHPATSPSARVGASAAYDPTLGGVVLFGGTYSGKYFAETWLFRNGSWSQITVTGPPPRARDEAAMAYDPSTGRVVLFGGFVDTPSSGTTTGFNGTWAFNGTHWTNVSTRTAPEVRRLASMAYDAGTSSLVLFGGCGVNPGCNLLSDTWEYSSSGWKNVSSSTGPSGRAAPSMAANVALGTVVLFGGYGSSGGGMNDTWTFGSSGWVRACSACGPRADWQAAMAFDPAYGGMIEMGGLASSGFPKIIAGTWLYT